MDLFVWNNRSVIHSSSQLIDEIYLPKQRSYIYLSHAISLLSIIYMSCWYIWYDYRFQICLARLFNLCQFTISFRKYRKKLFVTKQMGRVIWVRDYTFTMTTEYVEGRFLRFVICLQILLLLNNVLFIFADSRGGGEKIVHFLWMS